MGTLEQRIITEYEQSQLHERIKAVESMAFVHGFEEYYGETIQQFILRALAEQREEIQKTITDRMIRFANTPLSERKNAYDELADLNNSLTQQNN